MYRCTNDRYDLDGQSTYYNVEDFLAMCETVFNCRPTLTEYTFGPAKTVYVDEHGHTTLVPTGENAT